MAECILLVLYGSMKYLKRMSLKSVLGSVLVITLVFINQLNKTESSISSSLMCSLLSMTPFTSKFVVVIVVFYYFSKHSAKRINFIFFFH